MFEEFTKYLKDLNKNLVEIKTKMSMPNDITQICNSKFYLPNYPVDFIQNFVVTYQNYFERVLLDIINSYLKDDATILDIGANIGNHTLFWANERHAKKIHSFEPMDSTFAILKRNIEINHLEDRVTLHNVGISNENTHGAVAGYYLGNIGATRIKKTNNDSGIELVTLDSLNFEEESIDLMKIDTEGSEVNVLEGAVMTIKKYKPVIVIETFDNKEQVKELLKRMDYRVEKELTTADFIYVPNDYQPIS